MGVDLPSPDQPDPWVGRVLSGRYRIVRPLGSGGAGAVYEAEQLGLGRSVAVKLLRAELAGDSVERERFRREAHAVAQLGHPHIVQLLDFAEPTGGEPPYIVLELVRGRSLHQLLRAEAPLAPKRAVALGCQILSALEAAHRIGLVHRDVKPGNVVVSEVTAIGETAKVLDFGIARAKESATYQRLTRTGVVVGTPRYMSPEQASGADVDARTDVWAVGIILYAALTGHFPFDGSTSDVIVGITSKQPPPMEQKNVSPFLEAAVLRALEKSKDARYPSADAMAAALRTALEASPTSTNDAPRAAFLDREATTSAVGRRGAEAETSRARPAATPPIATTSSPSPVPTPTAAPTVTPTRWGLLLGALGLLGSVLFVLVLVVGWVELPEILREARALGAPAMPSLPAMPSPLTAPTPSGVPRSGALADFLPDAIAHAAIEDPSAHLIMASGSAVATDGTISLDASGSWAFVFASPGRTFQLLYAARALALPMVTDTASMPGSLLGTVDTAAITTEALRACRGLGGASERFLTIVGGPGTPTISMTNAAGAMWTGRLEPTGAVLTTYVGACE